MNKKCLIYMIASDKEAARTKEFSLQYNSKGQLIYYPGSVSYALIQHLYITSNEEIKEGDEGQYILHPETNTILRIIEFFTDGLRCVDTNTHIEHGLGMNYKSWRKIIASTDPKLLEN